MRMFDTGYLYGILLARLATLAAGAVCGKFELMVGTEKRNLRLLRWLEIVLNIILTRIW